jgi:type II secretory pathway pseudopilin PulG
VASPGTCQAKIEPRACQFNAGFSYLEVLIATALIAISLVPALEALSMGGRGHDIQTVHAEDHYYLAAKLEEVLAEPFSRLDEAASVTGSPVIATSYSDSVTLADGRVLTRQVYLSGYDGDNADGNGNVFDGTDEGLIWVRVEIDESGLGLERLTSVYE